MPYSFLRITLQAKKGILFALKESTNLESMKKIILLILISLSFCISGFSQVERNNSFISESPVVETSGNSLEVKIYPNPVKNQKVTIEFNTLEISEIKINNIAGKEVFNQKFDYPENKKMVRLNDVPNGVYLIRIKTSNNQLLVKKLVVANQ